MSTIIGREKEKKELEKLYNSRYPEFVAVYGRRRVGKTFLISEYFNNSFSFSHSGLSPIEMNDTPNSKLQMQLNSFYNSLVKYGLKKTKTPQNWLDAFLLLEELLESKKEDRLLVFLGEIQWFDTPKSYFTTALESFWNGWASKKNIMLIVCGSSTSWIMNKLINNHGGLYDRITYQIELSPFTLKECKDYLNSMNIRMSNYDIVQSYMAVGGIPYYLHYFDEELSFPKNIDNLFFDKKAKLKDEYDRMFSSVFSNPEQMKRLVKCLFTKKVGLTRKELLDKLNIQSSGQITEQLEALISSDIIIKYYSFGESKREQLYKIVDPFCLFYLNFVDNNKNNSVSYFESIYNSSKANSWKGVAFENVCFNHIDQIKDALKISGVSSYETLWAKKGNEEEIGTQIDLILDRADNVIDLCEVKFYNDLYSLNKDDYLKIERRKNIISSMVPKRKIIHSILITSYGLKKNEYSNAFVKTITIDDLFR